MYKIITNSLGSGDWIKIIDDTGQELFSGHRVGPHDLKYILDITCPKSFELVEVNDEDIE